MIESILIEQVMDVANRLSYTFTQQWVFRIYKLGTRIENESDMPI